MEKVEIGIKIEYIPVNIWDDFYDDGYVPEGEKQETYAYVEDLTISKELQHQALCKLMYAIARLSGNSPVTYKMFYYDSKVKYPDMVDVPGFPLFERWELRLENLTHAALSELLKDLDRAKLTVDEIPLKIYSES